MFHNIYIIFVVLLCSFSLSVTRPEPEFAGVCSQRKYLVSVEDMFEEGQLHSGDSGVTSAFPCWFDLKLARVGQKFARDNFGLIFQSHIFSLCFLLAEQQTRRVLVLTKRSDNPEKAYRRYVATAQHIHLWYHQDILSPTWLQSVSTIRQIHQAVQKYSTNVLNATSARKSLLTPQNIPSGFTPNRTLWHAFDEDLKLYRISLTRNFQSPKYLFNQFTLVATLWTFMALPIIHARELGISNFSELDLRGFAHLWAVLGHALGIQEKFIFCKDSNPKEWKTCKKHLNDIYRNYIIPQFLNLDFEGKVMIESLLQAIHTIVPPYTIDIFLINILEIILGVPAVHLREMRSRQSRLLGDSGSWFVGLQKNSRAARWFLNSVVFGELQLASIKTFGDPGTNATRVALSHFYVD